MDARELTDRSQDDSTTYSEITWHGFPYFDDIEESLPDSFDGSDDVTDSQRCWVGYIPATDEFLAGYDLWLKSESESEDNAPMAGGFIWVRLTVVDGAVQAAIVKSERFKSSIYEGDTLDVINSRFPDLVEIDID